ncbi:MAG: methylase [Solirubrobacterales bacterium]|nr:methylase [Solirubrobacterales bacterium]
MEQRNARPRIPAAPGNNLKPMDASLEPATDTAVTGPVKVQKEDADAIAEVVPDGKVIDFVDGKLRQETPEEYVRQNVERSVVLEYGYPRDEIRIEFGIKSGSRRPRADIVIFHSAEQADQAGVRIVVETKSRQTKPADKKDGIGQLHSYMANCPNAEYGLWTNGIERLCFTKKQTKGGLWHFPEVVDIPARGLSLDEAEKPKIQTLKPATADNLLFAFRRCHNYIAPTEGRSKESSFWELLKLIFAKIEDERSRDLEFYVTSSERMTASGQQKTRRRIAKLFETKVVQKYPGLFGPNETVELKPETVSYITAQLQGYSLLRSSVDVKGVAYEEVVGANLRGDRGEFFTPRNACRMAVEMLDPRPGEVIADPACGTAGFLIIAMNHALEKIESAHRDAWIDRDRGDESEIAELYRARNEYLRDCLRGLDLNPELVRAARMNMVMNNDGYGGIHQADSLDVPQHWSEEARRAVRLGTVDVVFTNPPFGTKIRIDGDRLNQFDLAAHWVPGDGEKRWTMRSGPDGKPERQSSQPPELLFIERVVQLLKPGTGRAAMVVPNGILNNPGLAYVRDWLLTHTQLLAVVDMQRDLFQPKNDTQTSMVFFRRLAQGEEPSAGPVFFAVADRIGHDKRGKVIFKRDEEGMDIVATRTEVVDQIVDGEFTRRVVEIKEPLVDDQLPEVVELFREWLVEHPTVRRAWRGD